MQLILVALGRGATFEVRNVAVVVGNYERTLELACVGCVYAEICAQFHGAANTLWNVAERAIAKNGRV